MSNQLLDAVLTENINEVKKLLKQRLDINAVYDDYSGNSVLHIAVINGNKELTEIILQNGGEVNTKNHLEQIPLHNAVSSSNIEITKLLIQYKSDSSLKDIFGNTPLFYAVAEDTLGGVAKYTQERAEIVALLSPHMQDTDFHETPKNRFSSIADNVLSISNDDNADCIKSACNYIYACAEADILKEQKNKPSDQA